MEEGSEEHSNTNVNVCPIVIDKIVQTCPNWVKITEIPHPALVPGFISRRECLPDGSIDPNTLSISTQMNLLQASSLSPTLAGVIGNVPSGMICESIFKRNLRDARRDEIDALKLRQGYSLSHSPDHYRRTSDPALINYTTTTATVNQTSSELSAINILYGGVRGKAYLDSVKSFTEGIEGLKPGSTVETILKDKLERIESGCGFKIFNTQKNIMNSKQIHDVLIAAQEIIDSMPISDSNEFVGTKFIIDQNHVILQLLNRFRSIEMFDFEKDTTSENLNSEAIEAITILRKSLLDRLRGNLAKLVNECPEQVKKEKFRGININI